MISFKSGVIEFDLTKDARSDLVSDLSKILAENCQTKWQFLRVQNDTTYTIAAQHEKKELLRQEKIESNLVIKEIVKIFPGSKIVKSTFH